MSVLVLQSDKLISGFFKKMVPFPVTFYSFGGEKNHWTTQFLAEYLSKIFD